jgi:hypothetical protein
MPLNLTFWLVKLTPFPDNGPRTPRQPGDAMGQAEAIQQGTGSTLRGLLDRLQARPGIGTIALRWVEANSLATLAPTGADIVVYLTPGFMRGVIQPSLDVLRLFAMPPALRPHYTQQYTNCLPPAPGRPLPEFGLTFTVTPAHVPGNTGAPWTASEVYVDEICARGFPTLFPRYPRQADWPQQVRDEVGRMIGRTAFHEAMHNRIDAAHREGWDMHTLGGLATSGANDATPANIAAFAAQLHRTRPRQYHHGRDRLARPPP